MSKIYKGYELIKAIAKGEIKKGTQFLINNAIKVYYDGTNFRYKEGYYGIPKDTRMGMGWFTERFKPIDDEINIQEIEELENEVRTLQNRSTREYQRSSYFGRSI